MWLLNLNISSFSTQSKFCVSITNFFATTDYDYSIAWGPASHSVVVFHCCDFERFAGDIDLSCFIHWIKMYDRCVFDQTHESHCSLGHTRSLWEYACFQTENECKVSFWFGQSVNPELYFVIKMWIKLHLMFCACTIIEKHQKITFYSFKHLRKWSFLVRLESLKVFLGLVFP
jgi:hypothetical protein